MTSVRFLDKNTECAIYASETEKFVCKGNYRWQSVPRDKSSAYLQVHPSDPFYSPSDYFLGVYGVSDSTSRFAVSFALSDPLPVRCMSPKDPETTFVLGSNSTAHFRYRGSDNSAYALLRVSCLGKVHIHVSWDYIFPAAGHNQLSSADVSQSVESPMELREYDPFVFGVDSTTIGYSESVEEILAGRGSTVCEEGTAVKLNNFTWKSHSKWLNIAVENTDSVAVSATLRIEGTFSLS